LERAGWFKNRKIDITNYVKMLESAGYEVFDAAKKFMEEYGELIIVAKYIDPLGEEDYEEDSTCFEDINYYCKYNTNYDEEVGERTIPVCKLYRGEYIVCISESGKLFISEGMRAKDTYNLWNGLWGEYKCGFLKWIDYKAGKEFQRSQYKNKNYF